MMAAYPLQWPAHWPRTRWPERHPSMVRNFVRNRDEVVKQLDALGASGMIISSNLKPRLDGIPLSGQREPEDSGVAVYFTLNGQQQCIPCDKWDTAAQNLRAVALTVEALRGIERWGAQEMVNAAFRGFKALPEAIITPEPREAWWQILEVDPDTADMVIISRAYKTKLHMAHPDKGGTTEEFQKVQKAYEEGLESLA